MGIAGKQICVATITPFVVGVLISKWMQADRGRENIAIDNITSAQESLPEHDAWASHMNKILRADELGNPFSKLSLTIHRNGESELCGQVASPESTLPGIYKTMHAMQYKPKSVTKYDTDAILTQSLASSLLAPSNCPPTESRDGKAWFSSESSNTIPSILKFCDMGKSNTPIQLGHKELVHVSAGKSRSFPCHFHTREGVRILSLEQLLAIARQSVETCGNGSSDINQTCASNELHLYAVPAGRVFMFAPSYVGEIFDLPHVDNFGLPISLEVLSVEPKVFDVKNFFSRDEAAAIVKKALNEKSESHRMKRSSTGASGYNLNNQRTSDNGFDTHGKVAMNIKKRCFKVLGFDDYVESMADGLQVLRYNKTTGYIPHLDWIDDYQRQQEHNFDSAGVGSNRFATILLYMTDMPKGSGGELVFSKAWPSDQAESERKSHNQALTEVRKTGAVTDLKQGSWEEKMVATCHSRMAIQPNSARAVLFYSQQPNGKPDDQSLHGGCPVLHGEKWAANLWVWNAPRSGYEGAPVNQDVVDRNKKLDPEKNKSSGPKQLSATFTNSGADPTFSNAKLYFQETFWDNLGSMDPPVSVNTFTGHEWNVMVDEEVKKQWIIGTDAKQVYTL